MPIDSKECFTDLTLDGQLYEIYQAAQSGGGNVGSVDNAVLRADVGTGIVQNSGIIIDDATTSTQNNIAIRNDHVGQTNSALVLTPKGTGALIAGPKPDGTATGGNARGARAADLQTERTANTQVASGANAFVAGKDNTASGTQSIAIGNANTASGVGAGVVAIGNSNTSSGNASICISRLSTSSGAQSVVVGGTQSTASADYSAVLGGVAALSNRYAMHAHSAGLFAIQGDAQRARFVLRCKTTTNAAVEMALDGGTTYLSIPNGKVIACTINISGVKSDGSAVAHYVRQYSVKNVGGTSSEVYAPVTIGSDNPAGTTIALSANNADDTLRIAVTGIAAETWRWVASVDAVEIGYGT